MNFVSPIDAIRARKETSLTGIVRDEISRLIEAGALSPGMWVNEAELAARLGVSRAPVREACRGLEQTGLLQFVVNRGAFVREIDRMEAGELYDLRAALFGLAGRTLAAKVTQEDLAALRALLGLMADAAERGDLAAYYPLNLDFHRALLERAGNRRLIDTYQGFIRQLHLFRRNALVTGEQMSVSNAEHQAIYDALAARDPDAAARVMEAHVLAASGASSPISTPRP